MRRIPRKQNGRGHLGSSPQLHQIRVSVSKIPYYDSDHTLLGFLNEAKCAKYIADGVATAVRSKDGQIRRLYRLARERVYGTVGAAIAAMHGAASRNTERLRGEGGTLIAPPWIREHKR